MFQSSCPALANLTFSLIGVVLILGSFAFLFDTPAAVAQSTVNISIQNFAFNPSSVTVTVGTTVTWTNHDGVYHTVTSNVLGFFDSGSIAPDASYSHTFTSAGTFGYHCSIHRYMMGTVVVSIGTTTTTTTSSTTTSSTTATTSNTTTSKTSTSATTSHTTTTSTTTRTSSTASTTQTTTTYTSPTTTTTASTISTSSNSSGGGVPEFPFQGVLVTTITLALVASYFVLRRFSRGSVPSSSP